MVFGARKKHSDCLRGSLFGQTNDQIGDALVARLRRRHFSVCGSEAAVQRRKNACANGRALLGEAGGAAIRCNLHSGCSMEVPNHID